MIEKEGKYSDNNDSNFQIGGGVSQIDGNSNFFGDNIITQKTAFYSIKDTILNSIYEEKNYEESNDFTGQKSDRISNIITNPEGNFGFTSFNNQNHITPIEPNQNFNRNLSFRNFEKKNLENIEKRIIERNFQIEEEDEKEDLTTLHNNDKYLMRSFKSGITETFGFNEEQQPRNLAETRSEIGNKVEILNTRNSKTPTLSHKRRITRDNFLQFIKANRNKKSLDIENRGNKNFKENYKNKLNILTRKPSSEMVKKRMKSIGVSAAVQNYDIEKPVRTKNRENSIAVMQTIQIKTKEKKENKGQKVFYHENSQPVRPKRNKRMVSLSVKNDKLMFKKLKGFREKLKSVQNSTKNSAAKGISNERLFFSTQRQKHNPKLSLTKINIDFSTGKIGLNVKPKTTKSGFKSAKRSTRRSSFSSVTRIKNNNKFFKVSNRENSTQISDLIGVKSNLETAIGSINNTLKKLNSPLTSNNF